MIMNNVHEKLFKEIKMIQEEVVYTALIENPDLKDLLFDITYDTIFKLLEVFDGYRNTELNLDIIDKKNKNSININRNLHDLCSKYLQDKGE